MESIFTQQEQQGHHDCYGLANALDFYFNREDMIWDVGCSVGYYTHFLNVRGRDVIGIEGTPHIWDMSLTNNILGFDLTKDIPNGLPTGSVMCIEVAEHIPKEFEPTLLNNINKLCKKQLVLSWAIKGQGGLRHVNEQNEDYVIPAIERLGFKYFKDQSIEIRKEAATGFDYFKNTIYCFERK